jgi:hypothetical protein
MENLFQEDDQAPLLEVIQKINPEFLKEESKDGNPLMSYSFEIIDLSKDNT